MLIITCPTGCSSFVADVVPGTSGAAIIRDEAQLVLGKKNNIYIQRAQPHQAGITEIVEGTGYHPVSLTEREVSTWWQQRSSTTRREPRLVAYHLGLESASDSLLTWGDTVRECSDQGANWVRSMGEQRVMTILGASPEALVECLSEYDRGFAEIYASA